MMAGNKLIFKNAEKAKQAIMDSQKKEIADLYEKWADDIAKKAEHYAHKTTASAPLSERYYKELKKQITATSKEVSNEIYKKIKTNIYTISDAVVKDNVEWLKSFGFSDDGVNAAFSYVPNQVVQRLVTGQIYEGGWNLSSRIWGDNEKTLKDIYGVMAAGLAEQKPIYDIAKDLEQYVRPSATKPWNLKAPDGKMIYKRKVDYNAQRLARTLAQHGYQQSFIATTEKNPFITDYIWRANGSRVCELCKSRDGHHYKKGELPMDHPNGMCVMEPVVVDDIEDRLADWFNSPDGTYPEIDEFAKSFGYEAVPVKSAQDFINKYGQSSKTPGSWLNGLTSIQKSEATILKNQSGLTWGEWYEKYIYNGEGTSKYWKDKKSVLKVVDNADDALKIAKAKFDAIPNKTYSGIWKDDVTLADYADKASSIANKKKYYFDQIDKYSSDVYAKYSWAPSEIAKYQKYLNDLDEFEKLGKQYAIAQKELIDAQKAYNAVKGAGAGSFDASMYTNEAKAAAKKFSSRDIADRYHRPHLDEVWKNSTDKEHYSVWEYTQNSNPINKSLSGYHDDWRRSSFRGLGNTDLGHEDGWRHFDTATFTKKYGVDGHKDYMSVVQNLTNIIDKSELTDSTYLVRGTDKDGFAGLLEGDLFSYEDAMKILRSGDVNKIRAAFEGQTFTNHAYTSTGISSGTGFDGNVKYEVYAPKGTKCIYAEPASYYGNTVGMKEKIYKVGQSYSSVGREAEVILQRGTDFRITKIDVDAYGTLSVKMEVVNQPDYFATGLEHTHNSGATSYLK